MNVSADDLTAEWKILRRLPGDMTTNQSLVDLAVSTEKRAMFPTFSAAVRKTLLLPIGTATVDRSFSTMNRILCSERCRLLPSHACQLMQLSIEGMTLPDVRDASDEQRSEVDGFINRAYDSWLSKPRRGLD